MIIVADASPLNYLLLIGCIDVLPQLYGRVLISPAVNAELQSDAAPDVVRSWVNNAPAWLEVRQVEALNFNIELDAGEREAISLALKVEADVLLIDERAGRSVAASHNLNITGTLGVLSFAAERGLIDLREAATKLKQTNFRAAPALWRKLNV